MIPSLDDLRDRVRALRTGLGLTQAGAAEEAGVSQSFVAKLENGGSVPNYRDAARLHNALEALQEQESVTAADLLTRDPVTVPADATVAEAAAAMKEAGFSQLPVVADGASVGSVTSRILLAADPDALVRDNLGPAFPTVPPETPRDAVAELLRSENAVLVADGEITGIITAADLL